MTSPEDRERLAALEEFARDMLDAADTIDLLAENVSRTILAIARDYAEQIRTRARVVLVKDASLLSDAP